MKPRILQNMLSAVSYSLRNVPDAPEYGAFHNVLRVANIYKKKAERHTLMELFTVTGKLKKFF
jgi:hypothetical protein